MYADRDLSKRRESTMARVNGCDSLRADGKSNLGRIIGINLNDKLSLRLVGICRNKGRNYIAGNVLPLTICPPDTVNLRLKYLARIKIQRHFSGLPHLHILQGLLRKTGQHVAVAINNKRGN